MTKKILVFFLIFISFDIYSQITYTFHTAGNWTDAANWSPSYPGDGVTPITCDSIIFNADCVNSTTRNVTANLIRFNANFTQINNESPFTSSPYYESYKYYVGNGVTVKAGLRVFWTDIINYGTIIGYAISTTEDIYNYGIIEGCVYSELGVVTNNGTIRIYPGICTNWITSLVNNGHFINNGNVIGMKGFSNGGNISGSGVFTNCYNSTCSPSTGVSFSPSSSLSPGGDTIGTTTFNFLATNQPALPFRNLNMQINSTSSHDKIIVSKGVNLNDAVLNVTWGFTPAAGQTFDLIFHGSRSGIFAQLNVAPVPGLSFYIDYTTATKTSLVAVTTPTLLPPCPNLTTPLNNAINVPINSNVIWDTSPIAFGYKVTLGTTPANGSYLNNLNVGNQNVVFNFAGVFNYNDTLYTKIIAYNNIGESQNCPVQSFYIEKIYTLPLQNEYQIRIKYPYPLDGSSVNSSVVKIYGSDTGLRAGNFITSNDTITFTADKKFKAGEIIHISAGPGLIYTSGISAPTFAWKIPAKTVNITNAKFFSKSLGITLPSNALNRFYSSTMVDMNKDGFTDIVFCYVPTNTSTTNTFVLVYLRDTVTGNFSAPLTYSNQSRNSNFIGTPDLNGDGFPDVVILHGFPSRVQIRFNDGTGGLGSPSMYTIPDYAHDGEILDMDKDVDLDIMVLGGNTPSANYITFLKNNGFGGFAIQSNTLTNSWGWSLASADIDFDGDFDMMCTSTNAYASSPVDFRVFRNSGNGTLNEILVEPSSSIKFINDITDFNNNGTPDIFVSSPSTHLLLSNYNSSYSLNSPPTSLISQASFPLVSDLDGDSDLDVFIPNFYTGTNYNSPLKLSLNNGSGVFVTKTDSTLIMASATYVFPYATTIKMADFDNDGDVDYLYRNGLQLMVAINDCHINKEITNAQSPLSGSYRAIQELNITGNNITVLPSVSVTFDASIVKLQGNLNPQSNSNIIFKKGGCDF
jgi:hypothetical protein